jgi:hypothetical protein
MQRGGKPRILLLGLWQAPRPRPRTQQRTPLCSCVMFHCGEVGRAPGYASTRLITCPCTSLRRKSRPPKRYVSFS